MIEIRVKDDTPELFQKLEAAIGRFVRKGAAVIERRLKKSMAESKSGKAYKRGKRGKRGKKGKKGIHIASAPGESPAIDEQNLTNSIAIIMENSLEAKIGTPVEYALYLEEGTSRMEQRPLWEKTAKDSLPTLEKKAGGRNTESVSRKRERRRERICTRKRAFQTRFYAECFLVNVLKDDSMEVYECKEFCREFHIGHGRNRSTSTTRN